MIKIIQFGEGNFLRTFADYYFDRLNREGGDYGVNIVKPINFGTLDKFKNQNNVYHIILRGVKEGNAVEDVYEIHSVKNAIDPFIDYEKYLAFARDKELKIVVSNTTEAGICFNEKDDINAFDGITVRNVKMKNVNAPIFIHVGNRMRGPENRSIGKIKNIVLENITAEGPYSEYNIVPWNYFSYKDNDTVQKPWIFGVAESFDDTNSGNTAESDWQMTSNACGLQESPLENIVLRNIHLKLYGGVKEYKREVPEEALDYPEVFVYGRILPAKGIYFRHIQGLKLENVSVSTYRKDTREDFVFDDVKF